MGMGLGIGIGVTQGGFRPYVFANAEAAALVARFTTPPTDARKKLIDTLVGSLKTAGVWSKLDALYVMAAADSQAARRNWIQDAYNLTAVNTPTFTVDRGYSGDGASAYLDTGFNPATAGGSFAINDAHMGAWAQNEITAGAFTAIGNSNSIVRPYTTTGSSGVMQPNNSLQRNIAVTSTVGHIMWRRDGASSARGFKNAVGGTALTDASTSLTSANFGVLARLPASTFYTGRLSVAHFGASLSDQNVTDLYTALSTYLAAVGAA